MSMPSHLPSELHSGLLAWDERDSLSETGLLVLSAESQTFVPSVSNLRCAVMHFMLGNHSGLHLSLIHI